MQKINFLSSQHTTTKKSNFGFRVQESEKNIENRQSQRLQEKEVVREATRLWCGGAGRGAGC
jgi:hypothetical protein